MYLGQDVKVIFPGSTVGLMESDQDERSKNTDSFSSKWVKERVNFNANTGLTHGVRSGR